MDWVDFWGQASLKMSAIWSRSQQNTPHYIHPGKLTSKHSIPLELWGRCPIVNTHTAAVVWVRRRGPNISEQYSNASICQRCRAPPPELLNQEDWGGGREFAFLSCSRVVLILLDHIFITCIFCGAFQDLAPSFLFTLLCHNWVIMMHLAFPQNRDFFLHAKNINEVSSVYRGGK